MKANGSKMICSDFSQHVERKLSSLSVTSLGTVTIKTKLSPRKRYALLQPWLDFANVALPLVRGVPFRRPRRERQTSEALAVLREFVERAPETDSFPAQLLRGFLKPTPGSELDVDAGAKSIADLADNVIGILAYCADKPLSPVVPLFYRVTSQRQTMVSIEAGRVARNAIGDPLEPFLRALEGTETNRIGRCPICDRFFFAIRSDRRKSARYSSRTRACSKACGTALRVREHRQRDGVRTSRAAEMLREGKGIKEIALALEVTQIRARRYVRNARSIGEKGA